MEKLSEPIAREKDFVRQINDHKLVIKSIYECFLQSISKREIIDSFLM